MVQNNITHAALKALIPILNKHFKAAIRIDPRTIMRTPNAVDIVSLGDEAQQPQSSAMSTRRAKEEPNLYWHHGLDTVLRSTFRSLRHNAAITIDINIDGLPLHKSTNSSLWPILCAVHERPELPVMVIGAFCGDSKPSNVESYLQRFVEELRRVTTEGLLINGKKLTVAVRCFVCDSPARAMIKGTVNYNGKHGCQKCTTLGRYSHEARTMIFPDVKGSLRTDAEFRSGTYNNTHCLHPTPLTRLSIDMVNDFVVADALHLLELGVMKRLLKGGSSAIHSIILMDFIHFCGLF